MKRTTTTTAIVTILLSCFIFFPVSSFAIPILGVAPGEPGSGGVYFGPTPSPSSYQWVFADTFVGGTDGFAMPSNGGLLSIWYGSNNGSPNLNDKLWLATTSAAGDGFTFGGSDFSRHNELSVASYKENVYALDLGTINNPNIGTWERLTAGEFGTGKKEFYVLTLPIEYSGFEAEDWMYAAVANSPVSAFSPKTTSATAPEPGTMILLGTGLVGLAGLGRKKLFKK
jgi:hypothetical protein